MKLTFRRDKQVTGLAGVGYPSRGSTIKLNQKAIGRIVAPTWHDEHEKYIVRFTVNKENVENSKNPNCSWKWITLKKKFDDDANARKFLIEVLRRFDNFFEKTDFAYNIVGEE